jgi:hypothetical protein
LRTKVRRAIIVGVQNYQHPADTCHPDCHSHHGALDSAIAGELSAW